MKCKLNVPYSEKDIVKDLGARWDKENKTWYSSKISDLDTFNGWIEPHNILCENLYLLETYRFLKTSAS